MSIVSNEELSSLVDEYNNLADYRRNFVNWGTRMVKAINAMQAISIYDATASQAEKDYLSALKTFLLNANANIPDAPVGS